MDITISGGVVVGIGGDGDEGKWGPAGIGTGVMVQADAEHESVTFTKATTQQSSRPSQLQIVLSEANNTRGVSTTLDNAIISFSEGGVLEKFTFNEDNAQISIPQDGKNYAVVSVGRDVSRNISGNDSREVSGNVSTEMPLNFKATKNGAYTLSFSLENMDVDYLHLVDNLTGENVDLLAPVIARNEAIQGAWRIQTTLKPLPTPLRLAPLTTLRVSNWCSLIGTQTTTTRPLPTSTMAKSSSTATLRQAQGPVVDMIGRVIRNTDVARNVSTDGMAPGVYVLRFINGENVKTQKVVVR